MSAGDWLDTFPGMLSHEPLARHSQFGVGGPARWFITTRETGVLAELLRRCDESGVPVTMLGAGSNTLISDEGIDGLVIRHNDRRLRVVDARTVELGAGCMMPRVALDCASRGLAGLEFGIGVPGTLGASVYGNAGAFGTDMAGVLVDCTSLDPHGAPVTLTAAECDFGYRRSRFKEDLRGNVIVSARLRVHADDPRAGTRAHRRDSGGTQSVAAVRDSQPGQRLQESTRRQSWAPDRGGGAEGTALGWCGDLAEARELHRQCRPRDCRRRPDPGARRPRQRAGAVRCRIGAGDHRARRRHVR